jgi:two-component system, NtrC family, sensor kinase
MVTPIYNEASCSQAACHAHPPGRQVLGVVDVGVSLAEADRSLRQLGRHTALAGSLGLLVLAGGVAFFARRIVVRPTAALVEATRRIAAGELEHRVPAGPAADDEIGLLARSFNSMTEALARAQAESRGLRDGLEAQVQQRTAALREAHSQLAQSEKLSSLGRMAASIAHEINNPLAGILAFAKLLVRALEEESAPFDRIAAVRQLRLVEREAVRCTAIVRSLLEFARQRPLTVAPVDVNAAVEEALSLVGHQLSLKAIVLERELGPVPPVPADFGQLRQAFVNVVLNAADAMAGGGRLKVTSRAAGPWAEVGFEDDGTGIPPEHLARIFDPFFSTKEKGTGLGLSVVYGIVQRHGGELDVRSRVGEGTCVRLRLPLAAAPAESA